MDYKDFEIYLNDEAKEIIKRAEDNRDRKIFLLNQSILYANRIYIGDTYIDKTNEDIVKEFFTSCILNIFNLLNSLPDFILNDEKNIKAKIENSISQEYNHILFKYNLI